jgi:hypothetical protein
MTRVLSFQTSVHTLEKRKKEGDGKKEKNTKTDSVLVQRKILFFITFPSWVRWLCPLKNPCEWGRDEASQGTPDIYMKLFTCDKRHLDMAFKILQLTWKLMVQCRFKLHGKSVWSLILPSSLDTIQHRRLHFCPPPFVIQTMMFSML